MQIRIGIPIPVTKGGHQPPSPGFEYPNASFCQDDGDQTPAITGTQGGVFSVSPSISGFNTTTGTIPNNSPAGTYNVTYSVQGLTETDQIVITADFETTFTYPNGENRFTILPTQTSNPSSGIYSFVTNPGNLTINATTGAIDLSSATAGQSYTVQYLPNNVCANPTQNSFTVVQAFQSFEFTIQVNAGDTFTIPTTGSGYNYSVNWGLNSNNNLTNFVGQGNSQGPGYTGDATSPTYTNAGTYTIQIGMFGDTFPRIYFNNGGDKDKMRNIVKWGEFQWTSFFAAFHGCSNLDVIASDTPDLTNCNGFQSMFHRCFPGLTGTTPGTNWNWTFNNNASSFTEMFRRAGNFNGDISNWDTSKVTNMSFMLTMDGQATKHQFNQNIGSWDVGEVTDMRYMFNNSIFNQDIGNWDTSKVTSMAFMFASNGNFNQDINTKDYAAGNRIAWDVSACTDFQYMFNNSIGFAASVDKWKIHTGSSNVNMNNMFAGATSFNSSLNTEQFTVGQGGYQQTYLAWDIQKVNNLSNVIKNTQVTASLSNWDTSNATTIQELFKDTSFNQPLINQQVTVGTGATARTYNAWDVSNITNMFRVFRDNNSFNQDLSSWDINTSGSVNMKEMFYSATSFDQDLSNWTVTNVNNFQNFMSGVTLLTTNYDAILTAWDAQGTMAYSGTVEFGNSVPSCDNVASNGAFAARASLITKWGGIEDKFTENNTCKPLAGFDYSSTAYCANGSDATPTITGTVDQTLPLGGNISDAWSSTTGLQINNSTGEIDVDQSTAGTYQITRNVTNSPGNLSSSATDIVTINPADSAAFSYSGSPYDIASASNPTPTVTGLPGGTFSSTSGLVFIDSGSNTGSSTGQINLSASTLGSYTVTYDTTGATGSICPETSVQTVQLVNTNFNFPSNVCNATGSPDIAPTNFISGQGGSFSMTPSSGLAINNNSSSANFGTISPAGSTAGTYAITYTIGSNSTTKNVTSTNVLAPSTTTNTSALSFNGTNSFIDTNSTVLNGLSKVTISFWLRTSNVNQNGHMFGNLTSNSGLAMQFFTNNTSYIYVNNETKTFTTSSYFSNNTWHNFILVFDGSLGTNDRLKAYVDGNLITFSSISSTTLLTSTSNLILGYSPSAAYFDGLLDEFAVWDTTLTSCDAAGIYQASSNGITADLSTVYPSNLKYYNRMGD